MAGAAALASGVVGLVSIAYAQNAEGGKRLTVTLGQSLEYSDNIEIVQEPEGNTLRSNTELGLRYTDITSTQRLLFSLNGTLEVDEDVTEFSDTVAFLDYALQGANTRLSFDAEYRLTDLDDISIPLSLLLPEVALPDEVVNDLAQIEAGIRTDVSYNLGFETGLQSLVGFRLDLSARDRRYDEQQVFNLFENTTLRADAELTFRIDPQMTARVTATVRRFESENAAQSVRTESTFGAGVTFDLTPGSTLDIFVGQERIRRDLDGSTGRTDGAIVTSTLTRDLPNGDIAVNFSSEPTLSGRDSTLRVSRNMDLQRDGRLSYGIGVNRTEGIGTEPLFNLAYVKPLPRGRLRVELAQEARNEENDDQPVVVTRLTAGYALALSKTMNFSFRAGVNDVAARVGGGDRRSFDVSSDLVGRINDISSWSLGAVLSDTRNSSADAEARQRRYGLRMSYRREVTRDWDMVAQYSHTNIMDTDELDRTANTISIGLERVFDTRF